MIVAIRQQHPNALTWHYLRICGGTPVVRNSVSGPFSLATLAECPASDWMLTGGSATGFKFTVEKDLDQANSMSQSSSTDVISDSETADGVATCLGTGPGSCG